MAVTTDPHEVFCGGGDSGSVVFDDQGHMVGLLFSEQGKTISTSYVIPAEDLFRNIKKVLKLKEVGVQSLKPGSEGKPPAPC